MHSKYASDGENTEFVCLLVQIRLMHFLGKRFLRCLAPTEWIAILLVTPYPGKADTWKSKQKLWTFFGPYPKSYILKSAG